MNKHTEGPWYIDIRKGLVGPRSKDDDQSYGMLIPIADVYGDNKEADLHLIKAAPDMLLVLKDIHDFLKKSGYDTTMVKSVINSAEGR